jgi:hypothetical protein
MLRLTMGLALAVKARLRPAERWASILAAVVLLLLPPMQCSCCSVGVLDVRVSALCIVDTPYPQRTCRSGAGANMDLWWTERVDGTTCNQVAFTVALFAVASLWSQPAL